MLLPLLLDTVVWCWWSGGNATKDVVDDNKIDSMPNKKKIEDLILWMFDGNMCGTVRKGEAVLLRIK
jgi:hypothetical protein